MLAFVTSLRHPQNSADYNRVESLLEVTLKSVTAQTSEDYVVIVVGNQQPSFALPEKVKFVPVDFPAPAPPSGAQTARAPFVWDKGTKIGVGLIAARAYSADYVMIFDADDFVSRRLAAFARDNPDQPGWVVADGLMYSGTREVVRTQRRFNRTCGTCFLVPFSAYGVPDLPLTATQQEIADGYGERLEAILGAHRNAFEWYRDHQGRKLARLPFNGAVYHVDTGENHSGMALSGIARHVSADVATEFALPIKRVGASGYLSAMGPHAMLQSIVSLTQKLFGRLVRLAGVQRTQGQAAARLPQD